MDSFLPEKYEIPESEGKYMKFKVGENRFRILTPAIVGTLGWTQAQGGKPIRKPQGTPHIADEVDPSTLKHFWAFGVWNVNAKKVQVLELTQKTIMRAVKALTQDEDWGKPTGYDIVVTKSGDGLETEYSVNPKPQTPVSDEIKEAWAQVKPKFNLNRLFDSGDPFGDDEESPLADKKPVSKAGEIMKNAASAVEDEINVKDIPF